MQVAHVVRPSVRVADRRGVAPLFSHYTLFGGRRVAARRREDREGYIVDQHGSWLFAAVLVLALLNVLDAFYTILFLSHGGTELNPFVDWVLQAGGVGAFLAVKSVGIGLCGGFLVLTKNFSVSRWGLGIVLFGYSLLLCWHVYLLGHIPA